MEEEDQGILGNFFPRKKSTGDGVSSGEGDDIIIKNKLFQ